ncbi:hypothetical protein MK805_16320 [Shimazuella sp. AN120528]|uniref:hypothetical protein n=1 Tax=Shimazuella soli TaxID=1892854 RepID=UPI001F1036CB|nr:hypothetical protein [Shimazuella soli]MCH5586506.1 hypothetical protein [Shimazuella soli]
MTRRPLTVEQAAEVFQIIINEVERPEGCAMESIPSGNPVIHDLGSVLDAYRNLKRLVTGETTLDQLKKKLQSNSGAYFFTMMYVRIARGEQEAPPKSHERFLAALRTLGEVLKGQEKESLSHSTNRFLAALRTLVYIRKKREGRKK